jgi:hypothetical protein
VKHICSAERLPFSLAYFGSLALTLFFAVGVSPSLDTCLTTSRVTNVIGSLNAGDFGRCTCAGRSAIIVPCRVLPRGDNDITFRWSDAPKGSRERIADLEVEWVLYV